MDSKKVIFFFCYKLVNSTGVLFFKALQSKAGMAIPVMFSEESGETMSVGSELSRKRSKTYMEMALSNFPRDCNTVTITATHTFPPGMTFHSHSTTYR